MYNKTGDSMWRAMALTQKDRLKVKIPKRQFIGASETLNEELIKIISKRLNQTIHKHLNYK